jgi:hypothetical protein
MLDGHTWRLSQREIREGKAPRRLAERCDRHLPPHSHPWSGAAGLARRVALAVSVVFLVIASTVVHSDDYTPASGPYVGAGWEQFDRHLRNLNDVGTAVTAITHSNDDAWKAFSTTSMPKWISPPGRSWNPDTADRIFCTAAALGSQCSVI